MVRVQGGEPFRIRQDLVIFVKGDTGARQVHLGHHQLQAWVYKGWVSSGIEEQFLDYFGLAFGTVGK